MIKRDWEGTCVGINCFEVWTKIFLELHWSSSLKRETTYDTLFMWIVCHYVFCWFRTLRTGNNKIMKSFEVKYITRKMKWHIFSHYAIWIIFNMMSLRIWRILVLMHVYCAMFIICLRFFTYSNKLKLRKYMVSCIELHYCKVKFRRTVQITNAL